MKQKTQKSFTLMELICVAVIVSALTLMALVNYNKMMRSADFDDIVLQLTLLHGAEEVYKIKHGQYWPTDLATHTDINEINTVFQLNLNGNRTYQMSKQGMSGQGWVCFVGNPNTSMLVQVIEGPIIDDNNPICVAVCP